MPVENSFSLSPDTWLRGLLVSEIAYIVEEVLLPEVIEEERPQLATEILKVIQLLKAYPTLSAISGVILDMEMFALILQGGVQGARIATSSVIAAKEHINDTSRLAL